VLGNLVWYVPDLLASAFGVVVAAVVWRRSPQAATLCVIAVGLWLLTTVGGFVFGLLVPALFAATSRVAFMLVNGVVELTIAVAVAVAWVLVTLAVFGAPERAR
jgi:hypothetical protein